MIKWLIQKTIPNHDQVEDFKVRERYGILSSAIGLVCNLILFLGKSGVGIWFGSVAILADAFNNLSDAGASVIGFIGVKLSNKPADKDHPFGHGRVEYISALIVSFLILQVGFFFFKESVLKIRQPREVHMQTWGILFLGISVGMKLWLAYFNRRLGKAIDSKVLKATATDSFGDALVTSVTLVSLALQPALRWNVDGFLGLVVSVFIMVAGVEIAKGTIEPLIGEAIGSSEHQKIMEFIEGYEGVVGCHDLIVHHYGPGRNMASVHVEISNQMDFEEAHHIIDKIEREILKRMGLYLVIHMDPVETENKEVLEIREKIERMVYTLEPEAKVHDFRVLEKGEIKFLRFDMALPYRYDQEKQFELKKQLEELIRLMNDAYDCDITVENHFIEESN